MLSILIQQNYYEPFPWFLVLPPPLPPAAPSQPPSPSPPPPAAAAASDLTSRPSTTLCPCCVKSQG